MYIKINDIKGEKRIVDRYLIPFTQKRKSQLLAHLAIMLRFCYRDL